MKTIFNNFLNKVFQPSITNQKNECECCNGSGYNQKTKELYDSFYDAANFGKTWHYNYGVAPDGSPATSYPWQILGTSTRWCNNITQDELLALLKSGQLMDLTHQLIDGQYVMKRNFHLTVDKVNQWSLYGKGHDSISRSILVEQRAKRLGVFGYCENCDKYKKIATSIPHHSWLKKMEENIAIPLYNLEANEEYSSIANY